MSYNRKLGYHIYENIQHLETVEFPIYYEFHLYCGCFRMLYNTVSRFNIAFGRNRLKTVKFFLTAYKMKLLQFCHA